jgi:hypothetical protein
MSVKAGQAHVASNFSWADPGQTDDPGELLAEEGVILRDGKAAAHQNLSRDELSLLGRAE